MKSKLVITGAESSGKSSLGRLLQSRFKPALHYIPEYARLALESTNGNYSYESLDQMWREHCLFQAEHMRAADEVHYLLDTDLINYVVWFQLVFGRIPQQLQSEMEKEADHLYLLLYPDIPWAPDPLRENPEDRFAIYTQHLNLVKELGRPFAVVKGDGEARLESAIQGLKTLGIHL